MGNSRNRKRKRPRIAPSKKDKKFKHGGEPCDSSPTENPGPSGLKIGNTSERFGEDDTHCDTATEGIVFMDLEVLFQVFQVFNCPECGNNMSSHVDLKKRHGFSNYIVLQCTDGDCDWKYCFFTSKRQGQSHEMNTRGVLAFREMGRGHNALVTFTKMMNMPPPPNRSTFTKIQNQKLFPIVKELAEESMLSNATTIKEIGNKAECGISLDGTWQRRGHVSHNGVVTAISLDTKKCLDVEILSDKCQACEKWGKKKGDPKYQEWKANHNCKINHTGSSNSMETAGALRIFGRSYPTRGLRYDRMLGDGDSSTYNSIIQSKPYGDDCTPTKLECIGHVQKRVGSRLRKLKSSKKGIKLSDGKGIGGKGRLTDSKIDILQNYYGLDVRENLGSIDEMATAIKATLLHVASTDTNPRHHLCPDGNDSWCGYKRNRETYNHKSGIPECIVKEVQPIFDKLSQPELLQKCTHGLTQNVNENLNGLIWDRCPKTVYVELETVALATYLAVLKFNDGDVSFLTIMERLNINPGVFTCQGARLCDEARIKLSAKKSSEKVKKRRKTLRHIRKKYIDEAEQQEGVMYEAGAF